MKLLSPEGERKYLLLTNIHTPKYQQAVDKKCVYFDKSNGH